MTLIKIKYLHNPNLDSSLLPKYATKQSSGLDLSAAIKNNITIEAGKVEVIPTGVAIALPDRFEAQIRPRSGLAAVHNITILNSPGTIDSDYRGEIKAILVNHGKIDFIVTPGMRIAQMIIAKYERVTFETVNFLDNTQRGLHGFGSTGK